MGPCRNLLPFNAPRPFLIISAMLHVPEERERDFRERGREEEEFFLS